MQNFKNWLKRTSEENPLLLLAGVITLAPLVPKMVDAFAHLIGSTAYARQVNKRK